MTNKNFMYEFWLKKNLKNFLKDRKKYIKISILCVFIIIIFLQITCQLPNTTSNKSGGGNKSGNPFVPEPKKLSGPHLIKDIPVNGNTSDCNEFWYDFDGAVQCKYDISWSGNIKVSAYKQDKISAYFENEVGENKVMQTGECERVYLKVEQNGDPCTFSIKYRIVEQTPPVTWTMLVYMCNTDLDPENLDNLKEMINGFHPNIHINVVILLDREEACVDYPFNEIFEDTRLYVMHHNGDTGQLERLNGTSYFPEITADSDNYEANMGNPMTLANFIRFGKANYPAQHYALIFCSHGHGVGGFSEDNHDLLHLGEINDPDNIIVTRDDFVDLLVFNCCYMGGIETAYQFRNSDDNPGFYAYYMIAAPTMLKLISFKYDKIFERISTAGSEITEENEEIYKPNEMTPEDLGRIIIEEERDSMFDEANIIWAKKEVLSLYDLAYAGQVKDAIDKLAVSLYYKEGEKVKWEALRNDENKVRRHYSKTDLNGGWEYEVLSNPLYELYDLCDGIVSGDFSFDSKEEAKNVLANFDDMLVYSYYGEATDNKKGISIFFPHGDYVFDYEFKGVVYEDQKMFQHQWWYNALCTRDIKPTLFLIEQFYGKLAWCAKGATPGDGVVTNYFELLDAWYDGGDVNTGGWNRYKY